MPVVVLGSQGLGTHTSNAAHIHRRIAVCFIQFLSRNAGLMVIAWVPALL